MGPSAGIFRPQFSFSKTHPVSRVGCTPLFIFRSPESQLYFLLLFAQLAKAKPLPGFCQPFLPCRKVKSLSWHGYLSLAQRFGWRRLRSGHIQGTLHFPPLLHHLLAPRMAPGLPAGWMWDPAMAMGCWCGFVWSLTWSLSLVCPCQGTSDKEKKCDEGVTVTHTAILFTWMLSTLLRRTKRQTITFHFVSSCYVEFQHTSSLAVPLHTPDTRLYHLSKAIALVYEIPANWLRFSLNLFRCLQIFCTIISS